MLSYSRAEPGFFALFCSLNTTLPTYLLGIDISPHTDLYYYLSRYMLLPPRICLVDLMSKMVASAVDDIG